MIYPKSFPASENTSYLDEQIYLRLKELVDQGEELSVSFHHVVQYYASSKVGDDYEVEVDILYFLIFIPTKGFLILNDCDLEDVKRELQKKYPQIPVYSLLYPDIFLEKQHLETVENFKDWLMQQFTGETISLTTEEQESIERYLKINNFHSTRRISSIQVKGLLGLFDHQIDLNNKLTIIYGENGVGKTMLFRLLDWLFNPSVQNFRQLAEVPFEELKIVFEDESIFVISRNERELNIQLNLKEQDISVQYNEGIWPNDKPQMLREIGFTPAKLLGHDGVVLHKGDPCHIDLIMKDKGFPERKKEILFQYNYLNKVFHFLEEVKNINAVFFIQTQRLLLIEEVDKASTQKNIRHVHDSSTNYAAELAAILQEKTAQYRKKSDDLKNSLSQRIISGEIKTDYQVEELQKMAAKVNQKRKELQELGLLSKDTAPLDIPDSLDDIKKAILAVNILDMQEQLKVYEEDAFDQKVKLFLEILNERRFSYKKIYLSEEKGFYFKNIRDKDILPKNLSSGEQHELVLLYELLFRIPDASLILLDEPEISLHIAWQKEFIEDMQDIIALKNFDFIVSTHSPSIINGEWDLTISLKGPEDA